MRPDRDDFIQINEDNIEEELKKNFVKRPYGDAEYGTAGPYDVISALKFLEKRFICSLVCWVQKKVLDVMKGLCYNRQLVDKNVPMQ